MTSPGGVAEDFIDPFGLFHSGGALQVPGDTLHVAELGGTALIKAGNWLGNRHNWARIAMVALGAGTILVGLRMITAVTIDPLEYKALGSVAKVIK